MMRRQGVQVEKAGPFCNANIEPTLVYFVRCCVQIAIDRRYQYSALLLDDVSF
jgi:hypothetical protein